MFEVSSIGYYANLASLVHRNPNILEYSRYISNSSGIYFDSSNLFPSIINRGITNQYFPMTPEIEIKI